MGRLPIGRRIPSCPTYFLNCGPGPNVVPTKGQSMNLWHDIRYGSRMLRKSPGFVVTAVVTLGIGIGSTTAIFSICDSLLCKPAPLPHMDSLAMVLERVPHSPTQWNAVTPADLNG